MTNKRFDKLFGGPPRKSETRISRKDMDLARSVQAVTEEVMLRTARHAREVTGQKNLCLAGGVALNCVANGRVLKEGIFEKIWIQPAAGDAGGALGAALRIWYKYLGNRRDADDTHDAQKGSYLGPEYTDDYIENYLKSKNVPYQRYQKEGLVRKTAELIAGGGVIGWVQGGMEFGPRALGARSIIGDARSGEMRSRVNLKIKYRESFRPFAPSVLSEKAGDYFDSGAESPYMLLTTGIAKRHLRAVPDNEGDGFEKLQIIRSDIPAVTHVDNSARPQTVSRGGGNSVYYDLINEFYRQTGCPVIINTSFNVRGEPIVCAPEDAHRCFMSTEMDYLVMGNFILDKKAQPATEHKTRQYFEPD